MAASSLISASTTLRGNISGTGSLRIEGRIRGDVSISGDVVVGRHAQVAGNISGSSVTVAGAVAGDLSASIALSVEPTARVVGDLSAPQIGIGDGALVRGRLETAGTAFGSTQASAATASARRGSPARVVGAASNAAARAVQVEGSYGDSARSTTGSLRRTSPRAPSVSVAARSSSSSGSTAATASGATLARQTSTGGRDAGGRDMSQDVSSQPAQGNLLDRKPHEGVTASDNRPRKQPPPPTVVAPRKGAKGRKKTAKR